MENSRKISYDQNDQPPKNYIWYKNGQYWEWNGEKWVSSKGLNESSQGTSRVYTVNSLDELQNPQEGDIAIIPDSWGELTIEPTVTEDNGTITKVYNVESYSANSRIRVTSNPTCFASSYVDSENNSHNSGSVSISVFPVGTKSITLWETGEFPEVHFYEEVPGATKEYVNGEWVDRADFSSAIENMSSEEKMQVRKNLGLYYEETSIGEKTVEYDANAEQFNGLYKVSNDIITESDIIDTIANGQSCEFTWEKEDVYSMTNIKFNVNGSEVLCFKVSDEESSPLFPHGIYATSTAGVIHAKLVYNGETTTIHKIDAKFLPEQESSGSSLPWLDVTALPATNGDNVDISSNISQSDWNDLLDGKYVGIHILPNMLGIEDYYTILSIVKSTQGFVYPSVILGNFSIIGFDPDRRNNIILYLIGSGVTDMSVRYVTLITEVPGPIVLTELPTTSISTQSELDAIGITAENVQKLVRGEASALCLSDGMSAIAARLNLEYTTYLASNNFSLYFTDTTHRYSVANNFDTITVTKTTLS